MAGSLGDAAQVRQIVDQAGEAAATLAIHKFIADHPDLFAKPKPEVPTPLKWAGGIVAALLATGVGGTAVWLMTTVNEMQVTLARMDERMESQSLSLDGRFAEHERRIGRLEANQESRAQ